LRSGGRQDEEKLLHAQIEEAKGPSHSVQTHFKSALRHSSFALVPLGGLAQHLTEPVHLMLGYNLVLHDPRRGPGSSRSKVEAFLRRVLVYGHEREKVEVVKAGNRGKFFATMRNKVELEAGHPRIVIVLFSVQRGQRCLSFAPSNTDRCAVADGKRRRR
jgi:hypothetical protein